MPSDAQELIEALVRDWARREAMKREITAALLIQQSLPRWLSWMGMRPRGLRLIYALRLARRPVMIEVRGG